MKHGRFLWVAGLIAATPLLFSARPAAASSRGRLNTTEALGAITLYEALSGHTTPAVVAGAATAYAYSRYQSAHRRDRRRDRWRDRHDDRNFDRGYQDYGRQDYNDGRRWDRGNGDYRR